MTGNTCELNQLHFSNSYTRNLPADPVADNYCRQVNQALFSRVLPTPVKAPELLAVSDDVAAMLGLSASRCSPEELANVFSGNRILPDMDPYASAYGGHQFGHWAGQLGDGRAINLGEVLGADGSKLTLQLKGAGVTPYSRNADGRAVLRSSVREFLCSEAMHYLGVPTTRALSLVLTGEMVVRDMFYDGHSRPEPGAIVCRVAPSFIRFGHFELLAARGDTKLLESLLRFVIRSDRPDLANALDGGATPPKSVYLQWFAGVCDNTLEMVVHWMRVGFVHGVMNTDNMSVLGQTIDYGPYGWIDDYNPEWTPNTTDAGQRRYRFGQQALVARWNLYQLANALQPVINDAEALQAILEPLADRYERRYQQMMASKLGLPHEATNDPDFPALLSQLDGLLRCQPTDMTLFFRHLIDFVVTSDAGSKDGSNLAEIIRPSLYPAPEQAETRIQKDNLPLYLQWEKLYRRMLLAYPLNLENRLATMRSVNPVFVLRNYLAQQAIDGLEQGDRQEFDNLLRLLQTPYAELSGADQRFNARRPEWAKQKAGCSMLSCSS